MNDTQKEILIDSALTNLKHLNHRLGYFISGLNTALQDLEKSSMKQSLPDLQKDILYFIDTKIEMIEVIQETLKGVGNETNN